jgi:hypothetical protein
MCLACHSPLRWYPCVYEVTQPLQTWQWGGSLRFYPVNLTQTVYQNIFFPKTNTVIVVVAVVVVVVVVIIIMNADERRKI